MVCFKPVLRDLNICILTWYLKTGLFLASVYACLDHPGCSNATSLRSQSQEGFSIIQSQSLKTSEGVLTSLSCVFLPVDMIIYDIISRVVFDRKSGHTEQAALQRQESLTVLSFFYSLNVNNCHCGYPQE